MSSYHHKPHYGPCHHGHDDVVVVETPGIQGPRGEPGPQGEAGISPDIAVEAETLPAGSEATAERSGSQAQPLITFGIPRGDRGEKGEKGEKGDKGDPGNAAEAPVIDAATIDNLF